MLWTSHLSSWPSLSWSAKSQIFPSIDIGSLDPSITFLTWLHIIWTSLIYQIQTNTLSPGRSPLTGFSWSNSASYFLFSSGLTKKLMLGAGVPLGASATLAPGAVWDPKFGASQLSSKLSTNISLFAWLKETSLQATNKPVLSRKPFPSGSDKSQI